MAVTPVDIAVDAGKTAPTPGSTTYQQWELWISDAVMLINERITETGAPAPSQAKIDYVVRKVVVAQVKKPDDATTVTVAVDDGSTQRRYESGNGRVTIDDEWWEWLGLSGDGYGAFTITPYAAPTPQVFPW